MSRVFGLIFVETFFLSFIVVLKAPMKLTLKRLISDCLDSPNKIYAYCANWMGGVVIIIFFAKLNDKKKPCIPILDGACLEGGNGEGGYIPVRCILSIFR